MLYFYSSRIWNSVGWPFSPLSHSLNWKPSNPATSFCKHIGYPYNNLITYIVPGTCLKAAVSPRVSPNLGCVRAHWPKEPAQDSYQTLIKGEKNPYPQVKVVLMHGYKSLSLVSDNGVSSLKARTSRFQIRL